MNLISSGGTGRAPEWAWAGIIGEHCRRGRAVTQTRPFIRLRIGRLQLRAGLWPTLATLALMAADDRTRHVAARRGPGRTTVTGRI